MRGVRGRPRVDKLVALLNAAKARELAIADLARKQSKAFQNIKWLAAELADYLSDARRRR